MNPVTTRTHLTIVEVADRWGVSPNFVRREIWRGEIKATRLGRSVRIAVTEADSYIQARTQRAG